MRDFFFFSVTIIGWVVAVSLMVLTVLFLRASIHDWLNSNECSHCKEDSRSRLDLTDVIRDPDPTELPD